jgi:hypothetical protein
MWRRSQQWKTYRLTGGVEISQSEVRCFQEIQVAEHCVQYFLTGAVILKITTRHHVSIQLCFLNHTIYIVRCSAAVNFGTRIVSFSEQVRPLPMIRLIRRKRILKIRCTMTIRKINANDIFEWPEELAFINFKFGLVSQILTPRRNTLIKGWSLATSGKIIIKLTLRYIVT